jgi:hypothetical protein
MRAALKNVPASKASEELARLGADPEEPVVVLRRSDMLALAEDIRQEAKRRGMSKDVLEDILSDL